MSTATLEDVMQVCLNGHVITDLLVSRPEQGRHHCERCGAATLCRCPTCGRELPGAIPVPGLVPIGERRAPQHCPGCGAAFSWTERPRPLPAPLAALENVLRRLPRAARQLRDRHGDRPPFRVSDVHDLEDLLRALLHLHLDDVRLEGRTPAYAPGTRTDFLVGPDRVALTAKLAGAALDAAEIETQLREDAEYYRRQGCPCLVGFVYDPEQLLHEPARFEASCLRVSAELPVRCVVAS